MRISIVDRVFRVRHFWKPLLPAGILFPSQELYDLSHRLGVCKTRDGGRVMPILVKALVNAHERGVCILGSVGASMKKYYFHNLALELGCVDFGKEIWAGVG